MPVLKEIKYNPFFSSGLFHRKKSRAKNDNEYNEVQKQQQNLNSRTYYIIAIGSGILLLVAVGIVHITSVLANATRRLVPPDTEVPLPPSPSVLREFRKGAVCSDGPPCSSIGKEILLQNGSAVDAAIATLFCNGLVNCQSMGLGGGFLMTVYDRKTESVYSLNARESAPAAAAEQLYRFNPRKAKHGALAVGVPGELAGYWAAHQRFGRLPWSNLVQPSIDVCRNGYHMSKHQYDSLNIQSNNIYGDPLLKKIFVNPSTKKFYPQGTVIIHNQLCKTLEIISEKGGDVLYNGSLAKILADDIQELGGIVTEKDLRDYRAHWQTPVKLQLNEGNILYSAPPPGSGILLALILNILNGYKFEKEDISTVDDTILTYHRIIEAFKYAFAKRTELGDPNFVDIENLLNNLTTKEYGDFIRDEIEDHFTYNDPLHYGATFYSPDDHGTAHVSVLSPEGDAVSVTSTINFYFGAGVTSKRTGIILNSGMDDFSSPYFTNYFGLPGSPANKLEPGKQSLSSMCPSLIIDNKGDVRLVIGAAGGTKITTAVAFVIIRHLWFGEDIKQAIDASRIHHQLFPMEVSYEYGLLQQIITGLQNLGHNMSRYRSRLSIMCAIVKIGEKILANADYRKGGDVHGI